MAVYCGPTSESVVKPVRVVLLPLPHASGLLPPARMSESASGFDLQAAIVSPLTIEGGRWGLVPTGLAAEIPAGFEGQIRSRSGLAAQRGVFVLNSPGTIDSDYRGELIVILANLSDAPFVVARGDRVAQLVFCRVERVEFEVAVELATSKRGKRGLGSSGTQ